AAVAMAVALAAAGAIRLRIRPPAGPDQWVRLTNFPDSVSQPALSPDGRMIAFVRGPDTFAAEGEIYVKVLTLSQPGTPGSCRCWAASPDCGCATHRASHGSERRTASLFPKSRRDMA